MILDLNDFQRNPAPDNIDICICGAGVAGITLALKLANKFSVLLLEAGGHTPSAESQDLYRGRIIGLDYFNLTATRLRLLGGSSNHWGGWCRPLDEVDFAGIPGNKYSQWPIRKVDLDPYLDQSFTILDATRDHVQKSAEDNLERRILNEGLFQPIKFWFSNPLTRFGIKYQQALANLENLTCVLNANVHELTLDESGDRVKNLTFSSYSGAQFTVNATRIILATGGIETPRILLNNDKQVTTGIGNSNDLVGRFFSEHPHQTVGNFLLENKYKDEFRHGEHLPDRIRAKYFAPTMQFRKSKDVLNFSLRFVPAIQHTHKSMRSRLRTLMCQFDGLSRIIDDSNCYDGRLTIVSEQEPNRNSRILLDSESDSFGMRRVALDWQLSDADTRTIRIAAIAFGHSMAKLGLGRLRLSSWILNEDESLPGIGQAELAGNHHMCTTRMGSTAENGVVDSNQKVFGIKNLYIAGSSVFSSAGHANPTLTIVQMTLRLADHLLSLGRA